MHVYPFLNFCAPAATIAQFTPSYRLIEINQGAEQYQMTINQWWLLHGVRSEIRIQIQQGNFEKQETVETCHWDSLELNFQPFFLNSLADSSFQVFLLSQNSIDNLDIGWAENAFGWNGLFVRNENLHSSLVQKQKQTKKQYECNANIFPIRNTFVCRRVKSSFV